MTIHRRLWFTRAKAVKQIKALLAECDGVMRVALNECGVSTTAKPLLDLASLSVDLKKALERLGEEE